ncbi:MAG TPA: hypothetical protein VH253_00605 [Phycisphaerae bacterium]|nr:hypothetical protein [Phycisphaerae bacterium]
MEGPLSYASPVPLARFGEVFRDGGLLLARHNTTLPARCVLCNGEAAAGKEPVRLVFTWDPSFRVTRESTLHLRQTAVVRAHLCAAHWRTWRTGRVVGIVGTCVSGVIVIGAAVVAAVSDSSAVPTYVPEALGVMLAGFVLLTVSMFLLAFKTRTLTCRKIDATYVHLADADEGFLAGLPAVPEEFAGKR